MRSLWIVSLLALTAVFFCQAQNDAPAQSEQTSPSARIDQPSQTARQALLEMFTGTKPGAFERHLPEAARKALLKGRDASSVPMLREFAGFRAGIAVGSQKFQTFDTGPILLSSEEAGQHKTEVYVERDDLIGDENEIELSLRTYTNGEQDPLPIRPRVIFLMKQESEVWTLNEVTLDIHVPLADPSYLKDLQKTQNAANESVAIANLRTIDTAEVSYEAAYPERGFTCKLSELGGAGTEPNAQRAMLISPMLASGKEGDYIFALGGCDAPPSSKFQLTATPADGDAGMRTFCTSESGVIRSIAGRNGEACLSDGVPVQ